MKITKILFLAISLAMAYSVQSQTLANYQFSTGHDATRWYTLDSTRNLIVMTGSRYYRRSALEEIGFAFPFADTSYSYFSVTHDGNLRLGSALAISSSGNQGSPFVASRAGTNNPKINFMGCAGYSSDSIYVHKQTFGAEPSRVTVVEFALQTYITASRQSLLRWQVQMHENGDIQIVYPSHNPPHAPACNHQQGFCVDETDIWIVDQNHVATHYTQGYPTHIPSGFWPDTNRYYRFDYPDDVCLSPSNLVAAAIETESVTLEWEGNASAYIVEYAATQFVPGSGNATQFIVNDNTATIYGLLHGTQYHFSVRSICGQGDTSNAAFVSAQTLTVEPVTASSYYCDFESADDRSGWIIPTGNIPVRWYIDTAVNNTAGGRYSLYVSQDSGATNSCGNNWIGTYAYRSINMEAGDWSISFDWRAHGDWQTNTAGNTNYYQFLRAFLVPSSVNFTTQSPPLFPVPNATPHGTAVPTNWIELNPSTHSFVNQTTWTTYSTIVTLDNPGCFNLVFYWESDGYDPPIDLPGAIDNIEMEHIYCPQPQSLSATVTETDILLRWDRGGSENSWRVVSMENTPWASSANFDMIVQDTFCLVTGLDINTLYNFQVYAICGEGDTSLATTASFRTSAGEPVTSYPYFCDFEDSLSARQWVTLGEGQLNTWHVGNAANNTPQGEKSLYVSQDGGATNSYSGNERSLSYAYRMLALDTIDYVCSFDWRCMGDNDFHFMRCFIVPANDIPAAGSFPLTSNLHISVPPRWIDLNPQSHYMSGQSSWTTFIQSFNVPDSGQYALLFMWENDDYQANNPPAAVDNLSVAPYTCPTPTELTADASQTYIDLTWNSSAGISLWLVEYDNNSSLTFTPSYNAENLTPNTEYTFSVRSLCTNGDTSLPAVVTVRTSCIPIDTLPYFCDFSQYAVGTGSSNEFLPCWQRLLNHSGYTPQINNTTTDGNNCLYWSLTSGLLDHAIVVLPELAENIEVTYTELHFKAQKYDILGLYEDPIVVVGVMSDPSNMEAFSPVDTIIVTNTNGFVEYTVPMLSYLGSDQYVAIQCIVTGDTYSSTACLMDDIALYEIDICHKPTAYSVETGIDTATIAWTPGGNESQWLISINDAVAATFQPTYIARGLEADTEYIFFVRSICDEGDTSEAIMGRFRTLQNPPEPPDTVDCPSVQDVNVAPINPNDPYNINVCWVSSATSFEIYVVNSDDATTYSAVVSNTNCHPFDLEGKGGLWYVIVRSVCDDNRFSEWSDTVYFETPTPIGIDHPQLTTTANQLSIQPNPSYGHATVIVTPGAETSQCHIDVIDIAGRVVANHIVYCNDSTPVSIRLNGLTPGAYYVRLSTDNTTSVKKLIVTTY